MHVCVYVCKKALKHRRLSSLTLCFVFFCRELLEKELESVGIRLNRTKPNIYFKVSLPFTQIDSTELFSFKGEKRLICCFGLISKIVESVYLTDAFSLMKPF